jgi:general secretion pathway protein E
MQRAEIGASTKRDTQAWVGTFQTNRIRKSPLTVVVSFYPTLYGEKILLKPSALNSMRTLDQLGLTDDSLKLLNRLLAKTEGLLLIMGPPDHGKTATLYSLLQHNTQAAMNALLIESPVELVMPGVTQVASHTPLSCHAWNSLVAYTNPDVLAISDLEDELLYRLAFEFAPATKVLVSYTAGHSLSGFRTFTEAMHTALKLPLLALLPVLLDILDGIIVQRLVRTLCPHCKEEIPQSDQNPHILQKLGLDRSGETSAPLYRAKGCQECLESGYHGQTGIFEIIRCDKHVLQALLQHPPISAEQWNQMLADMSVSTLQQQGAQLVHNGISSPKEVWRVLSA